MLVGMAGLAAAGLAWRLTPRGIIDRTNGAKLADIVPEQFAGWSSSPSDSLIQPKTEGKLADQLYSDTLTRIYAHERTGEEVMVLMAYGNTQSDLLQLHRPETCYPAFGYDIRHSAVAQVAYRGGSVPVRELIAVGPARTESILYWTRVGDSLPVNSREQRIDKLRTAMAGYIPDGLLARFSVLGDEGDSFTKLSDFVGGLLNAVPDGHMAALVGRGH
jgi:EpsI family protein